MSDEQLTWDGIYEEWVAGTYMMVKSEVILDIANELELL